MATTIPIHDLLRLEAEFLHTQSDLLHNFANDIHSAASMLNYKAYDFGTRAVCLRKAAWEMSSQTADLKTADDVVRGSERERDRGRDRRRVAHLTHMASEMMRSYQDVERGLKALIVTVSKPSLLQTSTTHGHDMAAMPMATVMDWTSAEAGADAEAFRHYNGSLGSTDVLTSASSFSTTDLPRADGAASSMHIDTSHFLPVSSLPTPPHTAQYEVMVADDEALHVLANEQHNNSPSIIDATNGMDVDESLGDEADLDLDLEGTTLSNDSASVSDYEDKELFSKFSAQPLCQPLSQPQPRSQPQPHRASKPALSAVPTLFPEDVADKDELLPWIPPKVGISRRKVLSAAERVVGAVMMGEMERRKRERVSWPY